MQEHVEEKKEAVADREEEAENKVSNFHQI
jgi:hypothetical protein